MTRTRIARTTLASTTIASIQYSPAAELDVDFRNGTTYRYFAVPESTVNALLAADSKGRYFNQNIRARYPHRKIE